MAPSLCHTPGSPLGSGAKLSEGHCQLVVLLMTGHQFSSRADELTCSQRPSSYSAMTVPWYLVGHMFFTHCSSHPSQQDSTEGGR